MTSSCNAFAFATFSSSLLIFMVFMCFFHFSVKIDDIIIFTKNDTILAKNYYNFACGIVVAETEADS